MALLLCYDNIKDWSILGENFLRIAQFSFFDIRELQEILALRTVHVCPLTLKFLVQSSNAEGRGLETAHQNFAPNAPKFGRNVRANLQDLF